MSIAPTTNELDSYPSSDGEPMAETPIHVEAIMLLHQALQDFFRDRPEVFVASDIFWYWKKGSRTARISPDVMVVPGVQRREIYERRSFFSWVEGAKPAAVFEMASRRTWKADLGKKYKTYEKLGVNEYFIFDPEFRYLEAPLLGFRLRGKTYRPIPAKNMECHLGFRLRSEGWMIRLIDRKTNEPVPTRAEAVEKARHEAERVQGVAESEKLRAEIQQLRAETEKQRADALAAEVERLKRQLGGSGP
jgi:Uma2 family endonuclease